MTVFPRGRAVEPDRIIDLEKFARWMKDNRDQKGLSLEILARHISNEGYPISQNKLYRIEQHLKAKADQKRPLMKLDYELKIRLESVFGEFFAPAAKYEASDEVIRFNELITPELHQSLRMASVRLKKPIGLLIEEAWALHPESKKN